jgi:hypothetical protein
MGIKFPSSIPRRTKPRKRSQEGTMHKWMQNAECFRYHDTEQYNLDPTADIFLLPLERVSQTPLK